jgi:hypothetical protein
MKLPRHLSTLFAVWGIAGTASTAFGSLRTGRREGNRMLMLHGLANLLVAATTTVVFVHQRRKDRT